MIPRDIAGFMRRNAEWFPIVSVTGPRQSGKSTLVTEVFDSYEYVNLEDRFTYETAREDPAGFIRGRSDKLIIDEAQRVPELFNMIQVVSDERRSSGQYVLSGSQNFLLNKQITQSLAGRVGLIRLLPFSYHETRLARVPPSTAEFMLQGGYPRLYDTEVPPEVFFRNYISTYLERDIEPYVNAANLLAFRDFIRLCAQNCGSLLNITRLSGDVGVSTKTASAWLSILEASYVLFRLRPYHANIRKRLTKTPKLYFHDTGLLCNLLGISTPAQLRDAAERGAIFENLVVSETFKRHLNCGNDPQLYFYRDDSKIEVDLVDATRRDSVELVEAKASQTFRPSFLRHLEMVGGDLGVSAGKRFVVMNARASTTVSGTKVWSLEDWMLR